MRIDEILHSEQDDEKIISFIKENCSEWLQKSNGTVLYRSTRDPGEELNPYAKIMKVRTNRRPVDTPDYIHQAFNEAIRLAGGVANRSNSLFTTPDYNNAASYGEYSGSEHTFIVMPIGEFHYTWSPKFPDWFVDIVQNSELVDYLYEDKVKEILIKLYDLEDVVSFSRNRFSIMKMIGNKVVVGVDAKVIMRGEEKEINVDVPVTKEMLDVNKLSEQIYTDENMHMVNDHQSEVMIHPLSLRALLINPYYYHSRIAKELT